MVKPITTCVTQKRLKIVVWLRDEKRRHERCKASNNNEGGREETSRKAQTEVDGQSVELSETTPARPRARTEPRSMKNGNHGDRPPTGMRSANVSTVSNSNWKHSTKLEHLSVFALGHWFEKTGSPK